MTLIASAAESDSAVRTFDIPSGDAIITLKRAAEQAGLDIVYRADVVQGITTNSVRGDYTPRQALELMVGGTTLAVAQDAQTGALAIISKEAQNHARDSVERTVPSPSASENEQEVPITLSPFEVSASNEVGYGATDTSSTSRVAEAYIDVPQTVNVVTSEFIEDYNMQDTKELFRYLPNVDFSYPSSGQIIIRANNVNSQYIDGIVQGNGDVNPAMPMQFFDRVEIVKGPTSSEFGAGEPGGIINYVSKTPQGINATDISFGVGNHQNYKFGLDTQGVSAADKRFTYRFNAYWEQGNYSKETWHHKGAGAALALKFAVNPSTTVQLIVSYYESVFPQSADWFTLFENNTVYSFLEILAGGFAYVPGTAPMPNPPSIHPWNSSAQLFSADFEPLPEGWGGWEYRGFNLESIVEHSIGEHIHIRNGAEYNSLDQTGHYISNNSWDVNPPGYPAGTYTGWYRIFQQGRNTDYEENLDTLFQYKFGDVSSETLIGATVGQQKSDFYQANPDPQGDAKLLINVYNPIHFHVGYDPSKNVNSQDLGAFAANYGNFINEKLTFLDGHVIAEAGWREDYGYSKTHNFLDGSEGGTKQWVNNKGVPRFSLTVKPAKWLSFYGLVSRHSDPAATIKKYAFTSIGTDAPAFRVRYNNLVAEENYQPGGRLIEFGSKASLYDGRITASLCYFHQINTGQVYLRGIEQTTNADGTQTEIAQNIIAGLNSWGWEAEVFGQATRRLTFVADYGSCKGHFPNFIDGNMHWWSQPTTISTHGKYDLGDLHGDGAYITFGGIYYGGCWQYEDPYLWNDAGQYIVDGGVGYRWDHGHQKLYLEVTNITNQHVFTGNPDTGWFDVVLPGEQGFLTYTLSF